MKQWQMARACAHRYIVQAVPTIVRDAIIHSLGILTEVRKCLYRNFWILSRMMNLQTLHFPVVTLYIKSKLSLNLPVV